MVPGTVPPPSESLIKGGRALHGLPSKQELWTLAGTRTVQTTVVEVAAAKAREVVDVVTDRVTFTLAARQELATADG
ncbi:hypothetical protein GCM10010297_60010 [Streptomyces malachitofuscus]|nr:hypothetical protein GCM10010297_60010 [Streptomyces malachitofuscus]